MIWANPWAWIGLAAIAVPIVVHLLARQVTQSVPFPTLRFLRPAAVVDVRRRRLTDALLLAVRIAIVAAAVAALAQPFWPAAGRPSIHRVVIVDASASVAADAAREAARAQIDGADEAITIERTDLTGAIAEAGRWLSQRSGRREVRVVSDFQAGALAGESFAPLSSDVGIALIQVARRDIDEAVPAGVIEWGVDGARTRATWPGGTAAARAAEETAAIEIVAAPSHAETAAAAVGAAMATASRHAGALRRALFVLPGAPEAEGLASSLRPIDAPWMERAYRAIRATGVTVQAGIVSRGGDLPAFFLSSSDPLTLAAAVRAAIPALSTLQVEELEPQVVDAATLRVLERDAAPDASTDQRGQWAGRWFWILALLLIGVESWLRRERKDGRDRNREETAHAA